ncbi:hypothetical protein Q5H92_14625 [Hymenobacter sp. M29]|uniref:Paraquat-inducible protein B n=1 Tax=Hymenobacter mellowenesis TaxID=3063995 RepID=A0ABT9ACP0_9BACT|nr:hypothetical protein [Hymenobacter sp. M29]MDO7847600.1 hypothetical protein [Hymenobacter sp. M29]
MNNLSPVESPMPPALQGLEYIGQKVNTIQLNLSNIFQNLQNLVGPAPVPPTIADAYSDLVNSNGLVDSIYTINNHLSTLNEQVTIIEEVLRGSIGTGHYFNGAQMKEKAQVNQKSNY